MYTQYMYMYMYVCIYLYKYIYICPIAYHKFAHKWHMANLGGYRSQEKLMIYLTPERRLQPPLHGSSINFHKPMAVPYTCLVLPGFLRWLMYIFTPYSWLTWRYINVHTISTMVYNQQSCIAGWIYIYIYRGFLNWGYPQIIHFSRPFHKSKKTSILGYPHFRKRNPHIYILYIYIYIYHQYIYIYILYQKKHKFTWPAISPALRGWRVQRPAERNSGDQ